MHLLLLFLSWFIYGLGDFAPQVPEWQSPAVGNMSAADISPIQAASSPRVQDSLPPEVEVAHQGALCTLDRIIGHYEDQVWSPTDSSERDAIAGWNEHPDLTRWMGRLTAVDSIAPEQFYALLMRLRQRFADREVRYVIEDNFLGRCRLRSTRAYVRLGDSSPTIYLCPAWLDQNPGHRIATLVHETVHTLGYDHPRGTDNPLEALELARAHPAEARISPENFESLVELYVCLR